MVYVPLMFPSEWREFPSAPCFALGIKTWWRFASRCCWTRARRLTCFLSPAVTRKVLQFGTWTDSSFPIDSVLRHGEVVRAKDLSASARIGDGRNGASRNFVRYFWTVGERKWHCCLLVQPTVSCEILSGNCSLHNPEGQWCPAQCPDTVNIL